MDLLHSERAQRYRGKGNSIGREIRGSVEANALEVLITQTREPSQRKAGLGKIA
jgi:hypothetical protein